MVATTGGGIRIDYEPELENRLFKIQLMAYNLQP